MSVVSGKPTEGLSFGQGLKDHFEFLNKVDSKIILLDEWDANLDRNSRAKFSEYLSNIAPHKLVLVVRH